MVNCHNSTCPPTTSTPGGHGNIKSPSSAHLPGALTAPPTHNKGCGPRNTSIPMPLPDFGGAPETSVLQTQMHTLPSTSASSQQQHPHAITHSKQQPYSKISPPLPVPSANNNQFNPIQSPPQIPGLPVLQSKNVSTNMQLHQQPSAMGFSNSMTSRIANKALPPPNGAGSQHTKPTVQDSQPVHAKIDQRIIRPSTVSYSNQLPFEGETHVQIIEGRQTKERLPLKDIDDLIHLSGPLTEDAVMRTLLTRFQNDSFYVSG